MHILFVTQYFLPEMGASAIRLSYQGKSFLERGHQVTVLTTFPNYPEGKIFKGYRVRESWKSTWMAYAFCESGHIRVPVRQ